MGGIVGFVILALIIMSIVLYYLVRRSVERRQARNLPPYPPDSKFDFLNRSRSSVAASDSPEVNFPSITLLGSLADV